MQSKAPVLTPHKNQRSAGHNKFQQLSLGGKGTGKRVLLANPTPCVAHRIPAERFRRLHILVELSSAGDDNHWHGWRVEEEIQNPLQQSQRKLGT